VRSTFVRTSSWTTVIFQPKKTRPSGSWNFIPLKLNFMTTDRKIPLGILTVDQSCTAHVDKTAILEEREKTILLDTSRSFKLNSGTVGVCAFFPCMVILPLPIIYASRSCPLHTNPTFRNSQRRRQRRICLFEGQPNWLDIRFGHANFPEQV
jgi:hypothetical protein